MQQVIDIKNLKGKFKIERLKIKPNPKQIPLKKPKWIRSKLGNYKNIMHLKKTLREQSLFSVCEEAQCPNLNECFTQGIATFMIMGQICTRRCPFCDVGHGRPKPLDKKEPMHLAKTIEKMKLNYVVITSVDRDDLLDGGAQHFKECIEAIYARIPSMRIEILTPDFRGRIEVALNILSKIHLEVFNHNLETVPSLYAKVRPGANYQHSLNLVKKFKTLKPNVITKSGLMLGLGEAKNEVLAVMEDLQKHQVDMLTLGQYLQPSKYHLSVERYLNPREFDDYAHIGKEMGFRHIASGPMVRSSYHADLQAKNLN